MLSLAFRAQRPKIRIFAHGSYETAQYLADFGAPSNSGASGSLLRINHKTTTIGYTRKLRKHFGLEKATHRKPLNTLAFKKST